MKNLNKSIRNLVVTAPLVIVSNMTLAEDQKVAWDEAVNGDLSNDSTAPSMIEINEPGDYVLRLTTGPRVPIRLEEPSTGRMFTAGLERMDTDKDGSLTRSEATANINSVYGIHFDTYDLNGDDLISPDELRQFGMGGDAGDVFNFAQGPGINLVAVRITEYDGGHDRNPGTLITIVDFEDGGRRFEAGGVSLTDKESPGDLNPILSAHVRADPDGGTEIYETYDFWKIYRRNDNTVWRFGEGQAKTQTEMVFTFE